MKVFILILTVLCFTSNVLARERILLISPLVRINERDLPKELNKGYKSFSQHYLSHFPKTKNEETLLNEFENAQKYYLVKSFDLARQYYEKVVSFSDMDEWREVHRKIIFISFIRLSEIDANRQKDWIEEALKFSLEIDSSKLNLSKETLKSISSIKKDFLKSSLHWPVVSLKNDFTYVLINGHVIDLKKIDTVKIPSGKFRVTFLSDIYKPQTYFLSSQQIPLLTPTRIPFLSGSCEKPFFNNEGEVSEPVVFYYSKDCIKNPNEKIAAYKPQMETELVSTLKYNDEPFYKKKWFLITTGILLTGFVIHAYNEGQKEKPTHETVNGF